MNNRKIAGILIFIWAAIFVHIETKMFGNNWYPQTMSELICDAISLAASFYGWYLILTKKPTS